MIKAGPCRIVQIKSPESDGYSAIQIAFGDIKPGSVNKPVAGHYAKAGVAPARHLVEIRVEGPKRSGGRVTYEPDGTELDAVLP